MRSLVMYKNFIIIPKFLNSSNYSNRLTIYNLMLVCFNIYFLKYLLFLYKIYF